MRRRGARQGACAVALAGLALAGAGCGGGGGSSTASSSGAGPLEWTAQPQVFRTRALPRDRVAVGQVRNTGSKPLQLSAAALVVRDASGRRLNTTGQYAAGYAHGLYGAFQKPDPVPPGELRRLGLRVTIAPGQTLPLAVSWHLDPGSRGPGFVDYGPGRLRLPARVRLGAGV